MVVMSTATTTAGVRPARNSGAHRAALHAFAWTAVFIVWHGYWALGGDLGFGDQQSGSPTRRPASRAGCSRSRSPACSRPGSPCRWRWRAERPRRLLLGLMWAGAAVLAVRGIVGLVDDGLRFSGLGRPG